MSPDPQQLRDKLASLIAQRRNAQRQLRGEAPLGKPRHELPSHIADLTHSIQLLSARLSAKTTKLTIHRPLHSNHFICTCGQCYRYPDLKPQSPRTRVLNSGSLHILTPTTREVHCTCGTRTIKDRFNITA